MRKVKTLKWHITADLLLLPLFIHLTMDNFWNVIFLVLNIVALIDDMIDLKLQLLEEN